jgi:hypothetical protein
MSCHQEEGARIGLTAFPEHYNGTPGKGRSRFKNGMMRTNSQLNKM